MRTSFMSSLQVEEEKKPQLVPIRILRLGTFLFLCSMSTLHGQEIQPVNDENPSAEVEVSPEENANIGNGLAACNMHRTPRSSALPTRGMLVKGRVNGLASWIQTWLCRRLGKLELVRNGVSRSEIILPVTANLEEKDAASALVKYIRESTGVELPVVTENEPGKASVKIYLGSTTKANQYREELSTLVSDGYIIDFPEKNVMVIAGAGVDGFRFAVYEFLERYVGVRWLLPGEMGEYVPESTNLKIPAEKIVDEPGFVSRYMSGWRSSKFHTGKDLGIWQKHMRSNRTVEFHHNLQHLLPPSEYGESHPEFFPLIDGKRYIPAKGKERWSWQPCFSNEETVHEAVGNIKKTFAGQKTGSYTYSLGAVDAGGYCECKECLRTSSGKKNMVGMVNYSNLYYAWVNKIARGVSEAYPAAKIGLMAYKEVLEPPQNKRIDPHVVAFICKETLSHLIPGVKRDMEDLMTRWNETECSLGYYDYAYGKQYLLPRVYPIYLAKIYRWLYDEHNVRSFYAEAYPGEYFAQAPKYYVMLKVLWNPHVDVENLLKEWCECAVGKDAAPYLRRYYEFYEKFWTEQVPKTSWFKGGAKDTYLNYISDAYLRDLKDSDLDNLQKLLETVVEKANPGKPKERAKFIMKGFVDIRPKIEQYLNNFVELKTPKVVKTLVDLDFETDGGGLGTWQRENSRGQFLYEKNVGHNNPGSRVISGKGSNKGPMCLMKGVKCEPGKIYRVSVWALPQGLNEGTAAGLTIRYANGERDKLNRPLKTELSASVDSVYLNEWQKVEITFRCPADEFNMLLGLSGADEGKVFYDELKIEEVTEK